MAVRKDVVAQITNACMLFNGIGLMGETNKKCRGGIVVRALVGGDDFGWAKRMPCLASNQTDICCSKQKFPTPDEAEALAAKDESRVYYILAALGLCLEDSETKGFRLGSKPMTGHVKCPVCGSVFGYSRSGYNGHISGYCMKPECDLEFIQ